jgi:uncharacterized protein (DUF952 family)
LTRVYKILTRAEWRTAQAAGRFEGSAVDRKDGFIHLSAASQAQRTAELHFAGQADLVVLELVAERLGSALKWEPSRGGELFPHIYGPLDCALVEAVREAPLGPDGVPQLGDLPA